ncbi:hypothetical protein BDV09DRAFT_200892 [Aspergillus tetrazonus]
MNLRKRVSTDDSSNKPKKPKGKVQTQPLRANKSASACSSACPLLPSQTPTIQHYAERQAAELAPAIAIPDDPKTSLDCITKIIELLAQLMKILVNSNREQGSVIDTQGEEIQNLETRVNEQQKVLAALKDEIAKLKQQGKIHLSEQVTPNEKIWPF